MSSIQTLKAQLQHIGHELMAQKLTFGNAGNISARVDERTFLVTASGTRLGELAGEDLVLCPLSAGDDFEYARKPSKELPMHRAVYAARPDLAAVIHAAPLYSTLIACTQLEIPSGLFIETMYYLERIGRVPYHHPGTQALGDAVYEQALQANVLLLENHGVLVFDTSLAEAMTALQTLETACQTLITARSAGIDLTLLTPDVVQDFLQNAGYKPRRQWS